jgi:hypothetical protein
MVETFLSAGRDESPFWLEMILPETTANDLYSISDPKWPLFRPEVTPCLTGKRHPFQLEITPFLTGNDRAVVTAQAPSCRKQPRIYLSELSNTQYSCANKAVFVIETHKVLAYPSKLFNLGYIVQNLPNSLTVLWCEWGWLVHQLSFLSTFCIIVFSTEQIRT